MFDLIPSWIEAGRGPSGSFYSAPWFSKEGEDVSPYNPTKKQTSLQSGLV